MIKIKINEIHQPDDKKYTEYDFVSGEGTYCAMWAGNMNTYPDSTLQDILSKHGFVNENKSLFDAHCTVIYSPDRITREQYNEVNEVLMQMGGDVLIQVEDVVVFANDNGTHLVAKLEKHPYLFKCHEKFISFGLTTSFNKYTPHVTLFTTDDILDPVIFDEVGKELASVLKAKHISFTTFTINNIESDWRPKSK